MPFYQIGTLHGQLPQYTLESRSTMSILHEWERLRGLGGGEEMDGIEEEGIFVACVRAYAGIEGSRVPEKGLPNGLPIGLLIGKFPMQ